MRSVANRRRFLSFALVVVALVGVRMGASAFGHSSASLHNAVAPGRAHGRAPTRRARRRGGRSRGVLGRPSVLSDGPLNPAWVRTAAAQDARVRRGVPTGRPRPFAARRGTAAAALSTSGFTSLGPKPERMTGCGGCFDYTTTAGRINAIVIDPTTTTHGSIVAYAASVGGGVWKTTNCCSASTTWTVTTDDPLIATTASTRSRSTRTTTTRSTPAPATSTTAPSRWAARASSRSTDGGAHWTVLGADVFGPAYTEPAGQFPQYDAVGKVRVDPNNSDNVVAGTKKGLYFSYDGGANWTGPCTTNGFTTMRQDITGLELSNMGGGVTRILAAVGVRGFATTVQYDLGQNGANGIYSATMPASGCPSFTLHRAQRQRLRVRHAVTGSPYATGAPMNAGSGTAYVRLARDRRPARPHRHRASRRATRTSSTRRCSRSRRTTTAAAAPAAATPTAASSARGPSPTAAPPGRSWPVRRAARSRRAQHRPRTSTTAAGDYPQNWYDQGIAVDPNNPDRVFFDTFEVWLATRTGTTWYDTTCGYSRREPEAGPRRPARARLRPRLVQHAAGRQRRRRSRRRRTRTPQR